MAGKRLGGAGFGFRLLALAWALAARPAPPPRGSFQLESAKSPKKKTFVYACTKRNCVANAQIIPSEVAPQHSPCSSGHPTLRSQLSNGVLIPLWEGQRDDVWVCVECEEPPFRPKDRPGRRTPVHPTAEFLQIATKNGG
ncbi:hypothetical protein ACQEWB_29810 [Streptomyces sp. CA-249302]|uniref:hypothetical protein n=1 Tax=Streptomyces sp. CA-249302 TaxID=3240058 RepID=UPI003D8F6954